MGRGRPDDPRPLADLAQAFVHDLAWRGRSPCTAKAYAQRLQVLLDFLARRRVRDLGRVRREHVALWVHHIKTAARTRARGLPLEPGTIRAYIATARRFFAWLVDEGHLLASPATDLSLRDVPDDPVARIRAPRADLLRAFLDQLPSETWIQLRDRAVLELAYSSGLRIGEVRKLDLFDVDFSARVVRVRQGKGAKDRVVPLGRPASRALARWLAEGRLQAVNDRAEHALFVTAAGRRLGTATMGERLQILCRAAGLTAFRMHDLRHASALHMLLGGADVRYVQELLGHATLKPTRIYTRLAPADLKTMHRGAHPRERHRDRP